MSTPAARGPELLCPVKGRQIEEAWARHHAGDARAFLELVGSIYDWLDRRVAAILRQYPGLGMPADEVLHDEVLDRASRALSRHGAGSCEEFVRLVSGEARWAVREIIRGRKGARGAEAGGPEEGDVAWLDAPPSANPLEELLAREEGERFAQARARFDEAAASLPESLRQAFCLRYYGGLSLAEAAAEVGATEKTVRNRVKEALDAISRKLTGKPYPGKPPQFQGDGDQAEGRARCARPGADAGG